MGKNSKTRHRGDRAEVADDASEDVEQSIALKRKLAAAAILRQLLGASRQDLLNEDYDDEDDYFGDSRSYGLQSEQLNDVSDTVATDWLLSGHRMPPDGSDSSGGEGGGLSPPLHSQDHQHLPSRKLILRQMVMNQLNVMQRQQQSSTVDVEQTVAGTPVQEADEAASEADSWLEMEERFAEMYEPIPFDVAMDSWRCMTKQEMLSTVTSRRLRSSMQNMSRSQILAEIRTIKVQRNKKTKSSGNVNNNNEVEKNNHNKNPVYEDMSGSMASKPPPVVARQQHQHKSGRKAGKKSTTKAGKSKSSTETPLYQNTSAYDGETLAEIYQAKVEAHRQQLRLQQQKQQQSNGNGLYVTRAMVHAAPYDSDDMNGGPNGENRKHFVSRADIVSKWSGGASGKASTIQPQPLPPSAAPTTAHLVTQKNRLQMMEELRRQSDYITTVYSVGGGVPQPRNSKTNGKDKDCDAKSCTSSCPSDCDGGVCDDDNCSLCSCSSCGTLNGDGNDDGLENIGGGSDQQQQTQRPEIAEQQPNEPRLLLATTAPLVVEDGKAEERNKKKQKKSPKKKKMPLPDSDEGNKDDKRRKSRNRSGASTPEPVPLNLVKQRRMEFERLRILDEQETRLKELVRRQQQQQHDSSETIQVQSWSTLARRAKLLEERWNQAQHHQTNSDEGEESDDGRDVSKASRNSKQRSKLIQQLKHRMRQNMAAESVDPRVRQRRHQKLKQMLSDAMHAGTQTLSNINLGLIYVPPLLDDGTTNDDPLATPPYEGKKLQLKKTNTKESSLIEGDNPENDNEEDIFGSIDTLIFEPKNSSLDRPPSSTATATEDDLTDVEQKIAQQFDYLYDSQYCGAQSDVDADQASQLQRRSTAAIVAARQDDNPNSKNVRQAAAAAAAKATTTPTLLHQQQQQVKAGTAMVGTASVKANSAAAVAAPAITVATTTIRSCAAAAYSDASVSSEMTPPQSPLPQLSTTDSDSDSDTTSNVSFGSVIYQGQKLLDLAQKQQKQQQQDKIINQQTPRPPSTQPPPLPPHSVSNSRAGSVSVSGSLCFDSEQYTNADTDASWDYYPDRDDAISDEEKDKDDPAKALPTRLESKPVGPALTVGNLRKRPTSGRSSCSPLGHQDFCHDAEANETARLLESLRMAEDSHVSTSLRLIFPPESSNKLKQAPSFPKIDKGRETVDAAAEHLAKPSAPSPKTVTDEYGSLVTHFRSLPELSQVVNFSNYQPPPKQAMLIPPVVRASFQPHIGIRKRDTMIRELKLKLKLRDKFQQQQQSMTMDCDRVDSVSKKPKTALDKLESILSSFSSLAEMKADGHIYRTAHELRQEQQLHRHQPLSLPDYSSAGVNEMTARPPFVSNGGGGGISEYDAPSGMVQSTGYPHHLLYRMMPNDQHQQLQSMGSMSDEPTKIYDPSLPDDVGPDFESLMQHQQHLLLLHQGLNKNNNKNPYFHEGLYSISEPLLENHGSTGARRHRRRRKRTNGKGSRRRSVGKQQQQQLSNGVFKSDDDESTWSDMENRIFAMQNGKSMFATTAADHLPPPPPPPLLHHSSNYQQQHQQPPHLIANRMAQYHGDEWLFWDQLHHWRRTMADQRRWEDEKARRMLLWIHHSQDPVAVAAAASLGPLAAGIGGGPTVTSLPHLPHWWQVD